MASNEVANSTNENLFTKFRLIAFLEGCSYLALAITMPLKYIYKILWPNYYVGMAHGVLFIAYCILLLLVAIKFKWGFTKTAMGYLASVIPFGTFIAAKKVYPTSAA